MIVPHHHDGYSDGTTFPKGRKVSTGVDISATPFQILAPNAAGASIKISHITLSNFGGTIFFYLTDADSSSHFEDFTVNGTTILIPGFHFKGTRGLFLQSDFAVTNCSVTVAFYDGN